MRVNHWKRAASIGLGLVALAGCGDSKAPSERSAEAPPVPVRVTTARPESVPVEVEAVGTVRSRATTVIASNTRGYVVEVRVREGTRVAGGDLLVRLEAEDPTAQLARAEAAVQAATHARDEMTQAVAEARAGEMASQAALAEARAGETAARASLAEAEDALEVARRAIDEAAAATAASETQAVLAQSTLARYRRMFEERALSQQEYDEVVARDRTARAELERARARVEGARAALAQQRSRIEGARAALTQQQSRIGQAESAVQAARVRVQALQSRGQGAEARIREAEAEAKRARVQLRYAEIRAPGVGLVVEKMVEVGELATPGKPLFRLDDPSGYRLEAQLASGQAARVRVGQPVEVRVDDLGERVLPGKVAEIVPTADPATRTVTIKVDLPRSEGLRSGLYGKARFVTGQAESLRVPLAAVVERGQLTSVFVVDKERVARLRLVSLGRRQGDGVEVLSGLSPGERVVVEGVERIGDGRRVDPKE